MRKSKPKTKPPAKARQQRHTEPVQPGQRLLFKPQVVALTGVCYSTLYVWMRAGQFPRPVVLGPPDSRTATVAWHVDEVYQWIAALPRRELGTHEFRGRGAPEKSKPTTPYGLATAMSKALGKTKKPTSPELPKPQPKPARSRPARTRSSSSNNMDFETTTPAAQRGAGVP